MARLTRFYYALPLQEKNALKLEGPLFNHAVHVLRLKEGRELLIFNEREGLFLAKIEKVDKKSVSLFITTCIEKPKPETLQLTLCFPLIKPEGLGFIAQKATEIGCTSFVPIITEFTQNTSFNRHKFERQCIEACCQSERLTIPSVLDPIDLELFIQQQKQTKEHLFSAIERTIAPLTPFETLRPAIQERGCSLIVGPEGGFSDFEKEHLNHNTTPLSLSPHVLRSETACLLGLFRLKLLFDS